MMCTFRITPISSFSFPQNLMESSDEISEEQMKIYSLQQNNAQLRSDLVNLQNRFNEMLNMIPKIEDINKENNELRKRLNESNAKIEDYQRRIQISTLKNNELFRKIAQSQNEGSEQYIPLINQLKIQINELEKSHSKQTNELNQKIHETEEKNINLEKENTTNKHNLNRLFEVSKNYFKKQFSDINELCEFLIHPPPIIIPNQNDIYTNGKEGKSKRSEKLQERKYKEKYESEKMKCKHLELELLRLSQEKEITALTKDQQDSLINDLNRRHRNEMMQTETKYKQEIALIKAQTHIEQKRFHSIHTQTSSEKSISPETEIHENHSSSHSAEEPNEELLSIIHQFQTQIENLGENMKKYEEKIEKERKKNQQYSSVIERLHSVVKQQKRKIVLLKKQINAKNEYSYSQTNQNDTEITEVSINQKEEIEGLKKTLNIYEKILNEQKSDIDKVLNDRNNLIEVIQKQSQYIFKSDSFIDKLESKQKEQIIKIENKPINKSFCKADNDMENIDWSLENFPDDVVQIMKPVAENNCIPINTRIHHVMSIISRYTNNVESSYDNKLSKFKEENQETQKKLSDFVSGILSSLGEKNDLPENEIVDKVSQVSHDNLLLKQKVNELDLSLKVASSKKIDINETPTVKNLNQTIKELKAQNKRRAIEIKECKSAFIECQKKASDEKELLISSNERMKHEIGELQEQYNILHEQYDALVEKIDKIKVVQEEENNEHQKEIENLHEMNAANFDYIIQKSKEDLQRKDEEIAKIQSLLEKTQQKIYHMEESSRMTLEDLDDQTRQKLEKYKAQMEQKMEKAIQEKETEMEHIKEQYEDQINVLRSNISDEETHKKQILEAGEKIKEAEKMISELENKVIKLTYQIQQDNLKFKSDIERLERENKIKDVQQKAKLMSMETNYSIKTDEITQKLLNEKKEFMCFIVQQFNSFYDSTAELNEESVKMAIRGIKRELECQQKREEAIRMLVSAKKGQTTEDALTNMIISLHPKLGEKNHDKPRVM